MMYGSGLRADSLSNIPLNGRGIGVKIKFMASRNEPVTGLQLTSPIRTGYTAGTGGTLLASLIDDFGTIHEAVLFQDATNAYGKLLFSPATPPLVDGDSYMLVIRNVADDPVNNWRSVDGLMRSAVDPNDPPCLTELIFPGSDWVAHPTNQPMWQILYASSSSTLPVGQGVGYVDVLNGALGDAGVGIRQLIQPTSTLTVNSVAFSLRGMNAPGTISILSGATVVATAVLNPPPIPGGWAMGYFQNPVTLNPGSYYIQPTALGAKAAAMQKGWQRAADGININYIFAPQTFFNQGHAQEIVNGAWSDKMSEQGSPTPATDWMFYLQ